jgi:hypothetical protein
VWRWFWNKTNSSIHHICLDGTTEEVYVAGRKPNRFSYSHSQQCGRHDAICSVQLTLEGKHWQLLSTATIAPQILTPHSFVEVLQSWGNTWLWEHMTVHGGLEWLEHAIVEGTLVAVTDGLFIRELYPSLCSTAFVLECSSGCGQVCGSFLETLLVANAYRGELLGLMAVHLILLSVNKICPQLSGSVEIVSDCLGALKRVSYLPPYCIPLRCCHSDILKTILVYCRGLTFTMYYSHVKAHQDDKDSFSKLSRKAQLNCICNHAAKVRISSDRMEATASCKMFPLEPVGIFVGGQKMTLETGNHIHFWAHCCLARDYHQNHKILSTEQFDQVDWKSVHNTLHGLPRLFQLWASKHMLGIAGRMKYLLHQDNRSPICPSCHVCAETCKHIARCPEVGRIAAYIQSTQEVERWMSAQDTHPNLVQLFKEYMQGRGEITCLECSIILNLPPIHQDFVASQDTIGWDGFVMGMVSHKLLPLQSAISLNSKSSSNTTWWISGLITHLLQVTHTQWIYRCVLVHDRTMGTLILAHKEELLKEVEYQLSLGPDGLDEQDCFLLECNFDELATTTGEHQEYWLLAIVAAREASQLCSFWDDMERQQEHVRGWDGD